jgi:hypothetical protein
MVIVDSSVLVDHFNNAELPHVELFRATVPEKRIGIGDISLFEVLQGIRSDSQFEAVRHELLHFAVHEMVSPTSAVAAARNYRTLRRKGITVRKSHDVFIATFCIENGHKLLHNDRDFEPFEEHLGLKVLRA